MMRCLLALGAFVGLLTGCVPLPIPVVGTVDDFDDPPALSSPMAAGDRLVILGSKTTPDEGDFVTCIRSETAEADATLQLIPPKEFRDALFPWFEPSTAPWTDEHIAYSLSQPTVKAKISELNVHYAVLVRGDTRESASQEYFLYQKSTRTSWLTGRIIDLKGGSSPGNLTLSVSGTNSLVWLPLVMPATVAMTETPACEEYGRQLAAYLTGKPVPKPKSAHRGSRPIGRRKHRSNLGCASPSLRDLSLKRGKGESAMGSERISRRAHEQKEIDADPGSYSCAGSSGS